MFQRPLQRVGTGNGGLRGDIKNLAHSFCPPFLLVQHMVESACINSAVLFDCWRVKGLLAENCGCIKGESPQVHATAHALRHKDRRRHHPPSCQSWVIHRPPWVSYVVRSMQIRVFVSMAATALLLPIWGRVDTFVSPAIDQRCSLPKLGTSSGRWALLSV